jgi:hypothetical protein
MSDDAPMQDCIDACQRCTEALPHDVADELSAGAKPARGDGRFFVGWLYADFTQC